MKELTIEITNRCSLNCLQCSTRADSSGEIFFSLDKIKEYLEKYSEFEVVRISGGEPFEHPWIDKICKLIKDKKKQVKILSCGVYYNQTVPAGFLKEIKPNVDEIIFSYHGYIPTHENIVTSHMDWTKRLPYWDFLCDTIDNATLAKIPYSFETVLMQENFSKLEEIADNISKLGKIKMINGFGDENINWHILRFVKQGRGKINSTQALNIGQIGEFPSLIRHVGEKYPKCEN